MLHNFKKAVGLWKERKQNFVINTLHSLVWRNMHEREACNDFRRETNLLYFFWSIYALVKNLHINLSLNIKCHKTQTKYVLLEKVLILKLWSTTFVLFRPPCENVIYVIIPRKKLQKSDWTLVYWILIAVSHKGWVVTLFFRGFGV